MSQYPRYSLEPIIELAQKRISHPKALEGKVTHYEHHVGSWACTMLARHFNTKDFLITPEMSNIQTNKRPDFTIEKYCESQNNLRTHVFYEIKKHKGDHLEKALEQVIEAIYMTGDETGVHEFFVIIQRGLEIGFFEFQTTFHPEMDEKEIDHFKGCVPLLFSNEQIGSYNGPKKELMKNKVEEILSNKHSGVQKLLHQNTKKDEESLDDAKKVHTPCIFNLEKHKEEVDLLFHYISTAKPREIFSWNGKKHNKFQKYNFQQLYLFLLHTIIYSHIFVSLQKQIKIFDRFHWHRQRNIIFLQ